MNKEVKDQRMNTKTKALALLSVVVIATIAGSLIFAMQSKYNSFFGLGQNKLSRITETIFH